MESVLTVGHSNIELSEFLRLLDAQDVEVVADIRSHPYSRYCPQFNRESIEPALRGYGIAYVFMGAELGGRPKGSEFYDTEGHVLYGKLAQSQRFLEGLTRLEAGLQESRVAMMCSEEDPTSCHRRLLVARVLQERGVTVEHLRANGDLQADDDLETKRQMRLFDLEGEDEWRSTRSVLPRGAPPTSSEQSDWLE